MRNIKLGLILIAGLLVWTNHSLFADQIIAGASHDSWVDGNSTEANYGTHNPVRLRFENATWGNNYSMFKFDLTTLPENITVTSVRMGFFTALGSWPTGGANFAPVAIFKNTQDWAESTVTFSTAPVTDATATETLDHFGLSSSPVYFTGANTLVPSDTGWLYYQSVDTVALVQGWIDNPASNYGVSVMGTGAFLDTERRFQFNSSEAGFAPVRPQLVVDYTIIPEPATLSLFGVLGAAMLVVRRKFRI